MPPLPRFKRSRNQCDVLPLLLLLPLYLGPFVPHWLLVEQEARLGQSHVRL
jgi:hypothetical protein